MKYILDSGYLYARLNNNDIKHESVVSTSLPPNKIVYFPIPAVTEVAYLLKRDIGLQAVIEFVTRNNWINVQGIYFDSDGEKTVQKFLKSFRLR